MSGITGVFNRDGQSADAGAVGRMMAAAPHRGPQGGRCWTSGAIAIGHQHSSGDTRSVPQPVIVAARDLVISLDGRIDNRDELIAELFASHAVFRAPSDAELVLAAYGCWGESCAERLLGDFAFVIWDGSRRRLFGARDPMGIRPFFYHVTARSFVWASEVRQILDSRLTGSIEPNEGAVAEYLSFHIRTRDETLYKGVKRLPAGHTISVSARDLRIDRYWQPDPSAEVRYADESEYAQHCRQLLTEAVRCRLPQDARRVGAYLSGGLDSSSVVSVASSLGAAVESYSLTFAGEPRADESGYIDDVVARSGATARRLQAPAVNGPAAIERVAARRDVPDLPSDLIAEDLRAMMQRDGHTVVLTGIGGDYLFSGSYSHYADLIAQWNFAALARQMLADVTTADSVHDLLRELALSGIRPNLPRSLRRLLKPIAARAGLKGPGVPAWIEPALANRVSLVDRLTPQAAARAMSESSRTMLGQFDDAWTYLILERVDRYAAERGIIEHHPFFDRRLIEFAFAIPESQRRSGRHSKYVLRQAIRDLLPASVAARTDKADFSTVVPAALEALGGAALLDHLHIASLGWVRQDVVSRKYREARLLFARRDEWFCREMLHLWMVAGVELWYRTVFLGAETYDKAHRAGQIERSRGSQSPRPYGVAQGLPSS